jgi:hypothetical protein
VAAFALGATVLIAEALGSDPPADAASHIAG